MKKGYVLFTMVILTFVLFGCNIGTESSPNDEFVNPYRIEARCVYHLPKNGVCTECGNAVTESQGLEFTLSEDGRSYVCSGIGTCMDTQIVIPEQYEGKQVSSIGDRAFDDCDKIKSVVLPNSVESIGTEAFRSCRKCEHFQIPDTVQSIGNGAFKHCTQMKEFRLPSSIQEIPEAMFEGCFRLKKVFMTETVMEIGPRAFYNCQSLESISLPPYLTKIGSNAFYQCLQLHELVLPHSIQTIGQSAFEKSTNIYEVIYSGSLTEWMKIEFGYKGNPMTVCERVWIGGEQLSETVVIPDAVTVLKDYCFDGNKTIQNIVVHSGISPINVSSKAFVRCPALTDLYIKTTEEQVNAFKKTIRFEGRIHFVTEGD